MTRTKSAYTDEERDRIDYLIDRLPSLFFGGYDDIEWEKKALELAEIIKRQRVKQDESSHSTQTR